MSDEPKYTREIRDGVEVLVYESGLVKRADNGHFLEGPVNSRIATSEQGREMIQRRMLLSKQLADKALDEAVLEAIAEGKLQKTYGIATGEGWFQTVKKLGLLLFESKNARGVAEIANFLGKATGRISAEDGSDAAQLAASIVEAFERILEQSKPEHIDGKVIDG